MSSLDENFKVKNGLTVNETISAGSCIEADSFEKHGGTSSQFLKADGSVDSSVYTTCCGDVTGIDAGTAITVSDGNTSTPQVAVTTACNTTWNSAYTTTKALSTCPGLNCEGVIESISISDGLESTGGATPTLGIAAACNTKWDQSGCPGICKVGDITAVTTGPYLTGGATSGSAEVGIDSACASKWDTAAAGDISAVTTSSLLSGGGSSGSVEVGIDSGALDYLNQSACPGICCTGTLKPSGTIATNDYAKYNASGCLVGRNVSEVCSDLSLGSAASCAAADLDQSACPGICKVGDITAVVAGSQLTGGATSGSATVNVSLSAGGIGDGTYGSTADNCKIDTISVDEFGRVTNVACGPTGDISAVVAGTNLTGGGTSGSVTVNMATGGIGDGTYGSTADNCKIDTITVDAYGRVTNVACGTTGDIAGVTAGAGLSGGGTSGTPTLAVDGDLVTALNQSACPGIDCEGTVTSVGVSDGLETTGGNSPTLGIASACNTKWDQSGCPGICKVGDITAVVAGSQLTGGSTSGSATVNVSLSATGPGAGTYGSTSNACKIDSITLDEFGRVTNVACGGTGDIDGVTTSTLLSGGGTSGTVPVGIDSGALNYLNQSACPGICCQGTTTPSNTQTFTNKSGNISQWTNDCNYLTSAPAGTVTNVAGCDGITVNNGTGSACVCVDNTVVRTTGTQTICGSKTFPSDICIAESLKHSGDTDTKVQFGTNTIYAIAGGEEVFRVDSSGMVVNELSYGNDFRVESENNTHALFVDGSADNVGIGCNAPGCTLTVAGNSLISGNTTIQGNLSVTGDFTYLDTFVDVASAMSIINNGTGPALLVNQTGANDIINFQDDGTSAFYIENGGNVGLGDTNPAHKLDVSGNINATGSYKLDDSDVINAGKCFIGAQVRPTTKIADAYISSASTWNAKTTCEGTTTPSNTQTFTNKSGNISQWTNDSGYGTITCVSAGTNMTGGGSTGSFAINMATGGIGSGTYGSTSNQTKIDTITVDAYGRVTAVACGTTGDITGVTAGGGLSGGGSSGSVTVAVDGDLVTALNQSACPGICKTGTMTSVSVSDGLETTGGNAPTLGIATACNTKWDQSGCAGINCTGTGVGNITCITTSTGLDGAGSSGTVNISLDLAELADGTAAIVTGSDEIIYLDAGTQKRKLFCEIFGNNAYNSTAFTTCLGTTTPSNTQTFTNKSGNISQWTNNSGYTTCTGDITGVGAGNGLTGGGNSGSVTLNVGAGALIDVAADSVAVDLTELTDMTESWVTGSDEFVVLDGGTAQKRKLSSEIFGCNAFNSTGFTTCTGTTTPSNSQTFTNKGGNISQWTNNSGYTTCTGTTTNSNSQTFTNKGGNISQWTNDSGYTTCTGTGVGNITCISTAAGLDGAGSSGTVTVSLDLSELTDMTDAVAPASDELILLDSGAERRKLFCEIFGNNAYNSTTIATNNNQLTNGAGYTTCTGDITSVTAGSGLTGGATSGGATLNVGAGTAITVAADTVGVNSTCNSTWNAKTTCTGTVTCVATGTGLDGGITTSGTITLDLSELTDKTDAIDASVDEIIMLDNGAERRKRFAEIFGSNAYNSTTIPTNNNQLTNGNGYTTCIGDITSVTAGSGLTGGSSSGGATLNVGAGTAITVAADTVSVNSTCNSTWNAKTTCTGTVTGIAAGNAGIDVGSGTCPSVSLDLSELADGTAAIVTGTDEIIYLDDGTQKRKRFAEIFGNNAYNSTTIATNNNQLTNGAGYTTCTGTLVAANISGLTSCTGTTTPSNTQTFTNKSGNISQWTNNSGYTTCTGDITNVSAGTLLDGGGGSGSVTLNVDLSELTDMTAGWSNTADEFVVLDSGAQRRKLSCEIFGCNAFSNTAFTTCTGDITSVTAGSGLTGGSSSGGATLNVGAGTAITVAADTVGVSSTCNSTWNAKTTCTGTTTPSNTQTFTNKSGNISQWTNNSGYTTCTGDITNVSVGTGLDGGGASGSVTISLDLSELADGTGAVVPTSDEVIYLDGGTQKRKLFSEIFGCNAYSNTAFTTCTGDITSVTAGNGLTGGASSGGATLNVGAGTAITVAADTVSVNSTCNSTWNAKTTCTGTTTPSNTQTFTNKSGNISQWTNNSGYTTCTGTTTNSNTQTFTNKSGNISQWTNNSGYTTCTGDITNVSAGDGISGGGASGSVSLAVDSSVARTTGDTFTGSITLNDSVCVKLGSSADLSLFHNGTSSFIDNDKNHLCIRNNVDGDDGGNIYIMPHDNETGIVIHDDSAVCLYSDNAVKLCTQSYGAKTQGTHCASFDMKAPIGCFCTMGIGGQSRQSSYALVAGNCGTCCGGGSAKFCGPVQVCGSFAKSSGCFDIAHPLPELSATKRLSHSFVESPQADNIYSGVVDLTAGAATVNIDAIHGMTNGTLTALNRCFRTFTTNETNWDPVRGSVTGNTLTIESCVSDSTATISWMVLGERHDPHMREISTTDAEGRARVEYTPPVDLYSDGDWEEI